MVFPKVGKPANELGGWFLHREVADEEMELGIENWSSHVASIIQL